MLLKRTSEPPCTWNDKRKKETKCGSLRPSLYAAASGASGSDLCIYLQALLYDTRWTWNMNTLRVLPSSASFVVSPVSSVNLSNAMIYQHFIAVYNLCLSTRLSIYRHVNVSTSDLHCSPWNNRSYRSLLRNLLRRARSAIRHTRSNRRRPRRIVPVLVH